MKGHGSVQLSSRLPHHFAIHLRALSFVFMLLAVFADQLPCSGERVRGFGGGVSGSAVFGFGESFVPRVLLFLTPVLRVQRLKNFNSGLHGSSRDSASQI